MLLVESINIHQFQSNNQLAKQSPIGNETSEKEEPNAGNDNNSNKTQNDNSNNGSQNTKNNADQEINKINNQPPNSTPNINSNIIKEKKNSEDKKRGKVFGRISFINPEKG